MPWFHTRRPALLFGCLLLCAIAALPLRMIDRAAAQSSQMHLVVLAGQSNMAGRGKPAEQDLTPHPRVKMLDAQGEWVPAVAPVHFDKPQIAGVGPGRSFAIEYAEAHPDVTVGLVPCAVGGSSIDAWRPGQVHPGTGTKPWDDAVARITRAMRDGQVKVILWHQGESDAKPDRAEGYQVALTELIQRFRELVKSPEVPFIIGQLGQFPDRPWNAARRRIDAAQKLVARHVPHCGFVSSLGLKHKGDGVHFSAESARELGRRYFREYWRIVENLAPEVVRCERIWDRAPHNAFTDLIRYRDHWYCSFREGAGHVSPDGAVRILTSQDGHQWEPLVRFTRDDADLRDPKLAIAPDGALMVIAAGALHNRTPHRHQTFAWFTRDGQEWSREIPIGQPDYWLWRVTFNGDTGLGVGYTTNSPDDRHTRLYRSSDGRQWRVWVDRLYDQGYPNETHIQFVNQRAYCLMRRDTAADGKPFGLLGWSDPPYRQWEWHDLGVRIGGPALIITPHGRMIAVVRLYDRRTRTAVCEIDPVQGKIDELLVLPSGGDTSYAGLVWHDDRLWVSYYSGHEARNTSFTTAIYIAEVTIP